MKKRTCVITKLINIPSASPFPLFPPCHCTPPQLGCHCQCLLHSSSVPWAHRGPRGAPYLPRSTLVPPLKTEPALPAERHGCHQLLHHCRLLSISYDLGALFQCRPWGFFSAEARNTEKQYLFYLVGVQQALPRIQTVLRSKKTTHFIKQLQLMKCTQNTKLKALDLKYSGFLCPHVSH